MKARTWCVFSVHNGPSLPSQLLASALDAGSQFRGLGRERHALQVSSIPLLKTVRGKSSWKKTKAISLYWSLELGWKSWACGRVRGLSKGGSLQHEPGNLSSIPGTHVKVGLTPHTSIQAMESMFPNMITHTHTHRHKWVATLINKQIKGLF